MSSSPPPSPDPRLAEILLPALEKIIKNAASWRTAHSKLSHQCRSLVDRLSSPPPPPSSPSSPSSDSLPGPLLSLSLSDSELFLSPLISALSSSSPKLADPALHALHSLVSRSLLLGESDPSSSPSSLLLSRLLDSACSSHSLPDDSLQLLLLKTLLSAATSPSLRIHGDSLLRLVRTCYDLFLRGRSPVIQMTAKASLVQMLVVVFRRMEADSSTVPVHPIVVADIMSDSSADDAAASSSESSFVQGFITKIISDIDVVLNPPVAGGGVSDDGAFESTAVENTNPADLLDSNDKELLDAKYWEISLYKTALEGRKDELGGDGMGDREEEDLDVQIGNKLRRDAFLVFRALCKLSMKTAPKEAAADPEVVRGKVLALELLKILLENAGAVFRTSDRYWFLWVFMLFIFDIIDV